MCFFYSVASQVSVPATAEIYVNNIAIEASPLAANALPPLKLNQTKPTHNIPAAVTVIVKLCANIGVLENPQREPTTSVTTKVGLPAVTCTTILPAKS
ncbi:MAG: hypothetical protein ACI89P_000629 [Colwellia sp.]|jgi:hypothetical protein